MAEFKKREGAKRADRADALTGIRVGQTLPNGWSVVQKYGPERCGRYSTGYRVQHVDGRFGFLKALDYDFYLLSDDPSERLRAALDAYSDESRLLRIADRFRLDRIVKLYDGATLRAADHRATVSYLIFELADSDGRSQLDATVRNDYLDAARMLHDVAVGVHQLHGQNIAHQDIRAANVLCFNKARAKIADLGKAVDPTAIAEHVDEIVPGDETYAPPELLYNFAPSDWKTRRFGCDLYLLGSLIVTFFLGTGMTPQLIAELPIGLTPQEWQGEKYEDILPHLFNASAAVYQRLHLSLLTATGDRRWADDICRIVREICHPDPTIRGDPIQSRRSNDRMRMERYLSQLDRLTRIAQVYQRKSA